MYHQPSTTPVTIKYETPKKVYGCIIALLTLILISLIVGDVFLWAVCYILNLMLSIK